MDFNRYLENKNVTFAETIPEDLKCILCKGVLIDPLVVPCGHSYCKNCLTDYLNDDSDKYCMGTESMCKDEVLKIDENVTKNVPGFSRIKNLNVQCSLEDCKLVIDYKWAEWRGTDILQKLNAVTPWRKSHFKHYLDEAKAGPVNDTEGVVPGPSWEEEELQRMEGQDGQQQNHARD